MLSMILLALYFIFGYKSIRYCKANILHIRYELVTNWSDHLCNNIIMGAFIGWITIPIMILHSLLLNRG